MKCSILELLIISLMYSKNNIGPKIDPSSYCVYRLLCETSKIFCMLLLSFQPCFYRATRMHSADYAVAKCLSVRHTPVLCKNGYTYPQTFSTIWQPHHSSFSTPNAMAIFRRDPPNGAPNARGYENITIFDQYRCLWRNCCKIEPQLLWKANKKQHPSFRMVPFSMILSDI